MAPRGANRGSIPVHDLAVAGTDEGSDGAPAPTCPGLCLRASQSEWNSLIC